MSISLDETLRLTRSGDYTAALQMFADLLARFPDDASPLGHRAWLLLCLGRYDEAIQDYKRILERAPNDAEAAYRCGQAYRKKGDRPQAIAMAQRALSIDPLHRAAVELWRACMDDQIPPAPPSEETNRSMNEDSMRIANPIIQMIEKDTASFPTSVNPPVGHFLYSITRLLRPRLIIETGCYIGYSTLCMAEALARNQSGHIHSFDLFLPLPDTYSSPFLPGCRDSLLVAHAHAEKAGLANYVTFHKGDSSSSIPQVLSAENSALDLAFIDGDHWIRGCFKDWEAVLNLLCPGGIVLLHDTAPKNCGWCGPHTLIRECQKQSQSFQALNLPTPDGYGMGIIQKIGERMPGQWKPSFLDLAKEFLQMKIWWRGHKAVGKH